MARPQRERKICSPPENTRFSPVDAPARGEVILTLDEYEAVRLVDYLDCTHEQCAQIMRISRTTATEIYASARKKLARALVTCCALVVSGGNVVLCDGAESCGQPGCPRITDKHEGA